MNLIRIKRSLFPICLASSILLVGCYSKVVDPELERNRQLWSEKKISDYDLTTSIITGGLSNHPAPVLIKVRDGRNISTEVILKTDERKPEIYKPFNTVDKMFDEIEKELQKEEVKVFVNYDDEFGYPRRILVDKGPIDAHMTMEVLKFEVISLK